MCRMLLLLSGYYGFLIEFCLKYMLRLVWLSFVMCVMLCCFGNVLKWFCRWMFLVGYEMKFSFVCFSSWNSFEQYVLLYEFIVVVWFVVMCVFMLCMCVFLVSILRKCECGLLVLLQCMLMRQFVCFVRFIRKWIELMFCFCVFLKCGILLMMFVLSLIVCFISVWLLLNDLMFFCGNVMICRLISLCVLFFIFSIVFSVVSVGLVMLMCVCMCWILWLCSMLIVVCVCVLVFLCVIVVLCLVQCLMFLNSVLFMFYVGLLVVSMVLRWICGLMSGGIVRWLLLLIWFGFVDVIGVVCVLMCVILLVLMLIVNRLLWLCRCMLNRFMGRFFVVYV